MLNKHILALFGWLMAAAADAVKAKDEVDIN